jgi:hypothetical protein
MDGQDSPPAAPPRADSIPGSPTDPAAPETATASPDSPAVYVAYPPVAPGEGKLDDIDAVTSPKSPGALVTEAGPGAAGAAAGTGTFTMFRSFSLRRSISRMSKRSYMSNLSVLNRENLLRFGRSKVVFLVVNTLVGVLPAPVCAGGRRHAVRTAPPARAPARPLAGGCPCVVAGHSVSRSRLPAAGP